MGRLSHRKVACYRMSEQGWAEETLCMWEGLGAAKEDWLYTGDTDLIISMTMRVKFLSVREGSCNKTNENSREKPRVWIGIWGMNINWWF